MEKVIELFIGLTKEIWHTLNDASFYVLFGLLVCAILHTFVNREKIARHLGRPSFKSVIWAALIGIPLPLCSCGVIPTAVSLKKSGASRGAVLSFLITTPETGVDSVAISFGLLDPLMAFFRPVAAFITGIAAGIAENFCGHREEHLHLDKRAGKCLFCPEDEDGRHRHGFIFKFRHGLRYAYVELLGDIAFWLIGGIVLSGAIAYFIPQSMVERFAGGGILTMLIMLAVGVPLYICASASTPIAAALIAKGMSPGAAFVFLLAGPATNMAGMMVIRKFLGRRSLLIYLSAISVCAIGFGLLLDWVYVFNGWNIRSSLGKAGEMLPQELRLAAVILLFILILAIKFSGQKLKCECKSDGH